MSNEFLTTNDDNNSPHDQENLDRRTNIPGQSDTPVFSGDFQSPVTVDRRKVDTAGGDYVEGNKYVNLPPPLVDEITRNTYLGMIQDAAFNPVLSTFVNDRIDLFILPNIREEEIKHISRDDIENPTFGPVSAISKIIEHRNIVLLSEPGGGKSYLVNHLAYCLAQQVLLSDEENKKKRCSEFLSNWPVNERNILPLVLRLQELAVFLRENIELAKVNHTKEPQPDALFFDTFIVDRLRSKKFESLIAYIDKMFEEGNVCLMLDGLDEVSTTEERLFIRDTITAFRDRYKKIRILITCRVLSYTEPDENQEDLRLSDFPSFELALFDAKQISDFVTLWYEYLRWRQILDNKSGLSSVDLAELGDRLRRSEADIRKALTHDGLKRLAPNPLLLTELVFVHHHQGKLPDARVLVYQDVISLMLWGWEDEKQEKRQVSELQQMLDLEGIKKEDLERILCELAFEAHEQSRLNSDLENTGDISYTRLQQVLAGLIKIVGQKRGQLDWAQNVIDTIKLRTPILQERESDKNIFTFPHRTFQEYLASVKLTSIHLSKEKPISFSEKVKELIESEYGIHWQEVILLAVCRCLHILREPEKPLLLVEQLCPRQPKSNAPHFWRKIWLAGDILEEIIYKEKLDDKDIEDNEFLKELLERVRSKLDDLLRGNFLSVKERVKVGDILSGLGDPRFDLAFWYLPMIREPLLGFVPVSEGKFVMGSEGREVSLEKYWIAKYPVTVVQYAEFLKDSGFFFDSDSLKDPDNHPVRYVDFPHAQAYCHWLNKKIEKLAIEKLQSGTALHPDEYTFWAALADRQYHLVLPSTEEWEKAAAGPENFTYSTGKVFDPEKANFRETGIGTTTTVGVFPPTSYGLFDMSGNVWEWTRSEKAPGINIIRGGSFTNDQSCAECTHEDEQTNEHHIRYCGFRLAISPTEESN